VPRRCGASIEDIQENNRLSSGHYILAGPRRLPRTGYAQDCWDAKIFPENRQNKFLISRQEALRRRRNHPGVEIRRRKSDIVNASIRRTSGLCPRNGYENQGVIRSILLLNQGFWQASFYFSNT
jgi:hypothetical protein